MYYLNKCILKITITLMIGVSLTTQVFAQSSNIEKTILSEGISVQSLNREAKLQFAKQLYPK